MRTGPSADAGVGVLAVMCTSCASRAVTGPGPIICPLRCSTDCSCSSVRTAWMAA